MSININKLEIGMDNLALTTSATSKRALEDYVDLSKTPVLKQYLGENCQSKSHIDAALKVVHATYEAKRRSIGGTSGGGFAYPLSPEILAYAMLRAKNEIVIEIGGASGENAILLAYAGAKKVYLNEIDDIECRTFNTLLKSHPQDIRQKLELIQGNCLEVLENKTELFEQIGLIYCQNLLHFFNGEQQIKFFNLLKQLLKPGGTAIITANSVYGISGHKETFEKNPEQTSYKLSQCLVTDYDHSSLPIMNIFQDIVACPDHKIICGYEEHCLYERTQKTSGKWQVNNTAFKQLETRIQPIIKERIQENQKNITPIKIGSVRVLINYLRIYNESNLENVCKTHGFDAELTFVLRREDGHLDMEQNPYLHGGSVGIIIHKPKH